MKKKNESMSEVSEGEVEFMEIPVGSEPKAGDLDETSKIVAEKFLDYYNDVLKYYDVNTQAYLDNEGTAVLGTYKSEEPIDMSSKVTRFDTTVKKVKAFTRNLHDDMVNDFLRGKGIRITSIDAFDKRGEKIHEGLQSEFFGTDYGDNNAFAERYSCECKYLIGKQFKGEFCPLCNTEVQYNENDLEKTGWIILDNYKVISPIFYKKLEQALGKFDASQTVIARILDVAANRDPSQAFDEKDIENMNKHPYSRKGMTWLCDHMLEVLEFYRKGRTNKADLFEELIDNVDKITTDAIPIYSAVMRTEAPGKKGEKMYKIKINTLFQSIICSANFINRHTDPDKVTVEESCLIDKQLKSIQQELSEVYDEEFNTISGKKGEILGKVIAGRYNFTSRMIIIAGSGILRANEIILSYIAFLELFRYELIVLNSRLRDITYAESQNMWHRAKSHFDPTFYALAESMIKDPKNIPYVCLIINRNPSINFGSFNTAVIAGIKSDINDKTMTINTRIIKTMNADFDGDQMNIFRPVGSFLCAKFAENMDPIRNLYVDRINGHVNRDMLNIKDEFVVYHSFMTCG